MPRASAIKPAGSWSGPAADIARLTFDERYRRRIRLRAEGGLDFLLDLESAAVLGDGDALVLDDGRLVAIHAADEPLLQITGRDAAHLARLAWHLGNRHLPAAIDGARILIRDDHVIADMLRGLGAEVTQVAAPFTPEGGAYGARGTGHHHDDHDHDHHGHDHDHSHGGAHRHG